MAADISGAIGRWPFDGALTAAVGPSNFTATGGSPTYQAGQVGQEVVLPAGVNLTAPDNSLFDFGAEDSFTVSLYVSNSGYSGFPTVIRKKAGLGAGQVGWALYLTPSGAVIWSIADGTTRADITVAGVGAGVDQFLDFGVDRATDTMWVRRDGAVVANTPSNGPVSAVGSLANSEPIITSRSSGVTTTMDEMRIYDRALTDEDSAALYAFTGVNRRRRIIIGAAA